MTKPIVRKTLLGIAIISGMTAASAAIAQQGEMNTTDEALVESLQATRDAMEAQMPGLSPEEIKIVQDLYDEQEKARHNPIPPTVSNKVTILKRGESPSLSIMERFDTTLVFADRHGNSMEITAFRISDKEAAALVPLRSQGTQALAGNVDENGAISPGAADSKGPIKALIVTPNATMRSTNITVMLKGQTFPIVTSLSTLSTRSEGESLAYIQEMRLSWASTMPEAKALAGKFSGGNNGGGVLTQRMVSLVQGVPDGSLEPVSLKGSASSQVSLWHDPENEEWYLRLAEHIEPWNISIADRTNDGLRGFSVIRLNGAPPRLIGLSVNGQYTTVEQES